MAALDPFQGHDESPVSLMIEYDGKSYVLCTLQHDKHFQQPLDLEFASGEELTLFVKGKGVVHLSGYVLPEDEFPGPCDDMDDSDEDKEDEDDDDDEDVPQLSCQSKKRQKSEEETKKSSKKAKMTIEDIDEDDDDDDTDAEFIDDEAEEESCEEAEDDDDNDDVDLEKELLNEDSDESSNDDDEMDIKNQKKAVTVDKKPDIGKKTEKNVGDAKAKPAVQTTVEKTVSTKQAVQPSSAASADTSQGQMWQTAEGKSRKKKNKKKKKKVATEQQVRVYYTGRLASGKIFDSTTMGNGFKFKLGKKEVISGWDVGLSGMKVGGKRKLVVPAKMGYGSQQAGPIPPNSTLFFDVELRAVS